MSVDLISLRAEALFVSDVQPSDEPTRAALRLAIVSTIRTKGGYPACAALMAAEFGKSPEVACARMQWALAMATSITTVRTADGERPTLACV